MSEIKKTDCYECKHRRDTPPNSRHSSCDFYWRNKKSLKQERLELISNVRPYAVESGWFEFPFDYDPVWIEFGCKRFEPKDKEDNV